MDDRIEIIALLSAFKSCAMEDTFDDGSFAVYDATELRIRSPLDYKDQLIWIYHTSEVAPDSLWRKQDQSIRFLIEKKVLERLIARESTVLFSGALRDLAPYNE